LFGLRNTKLVSGLVSAAVSAISFASAGGAYGIAANHLYHAFIVIKTNRWYYLLSKGTGGIEVRRSDV
jgi:hypothetical protein